MAIDNEEVVIETAGIPAQEEAQAAVEAGKEVTYLGTKIGTVGPLGEVWTTTGWRSPELPPTPEPEPIPTPEGYERVEEAGKTYFVKDGIYYQQFEVEGELYRAPTPMPTPREAIIEKYGVTGTRADVTPESVTTEGMRPDEIVIAMKDAGADVATLIKYLDVNPTASRGAAVSQLKQGLGAQFEKFGELGGLPRIETARTLGLLPKDFYDLPQELQDAYGVSSAAFNTAVEAYNRDIAARQAEINTALAKLEPYKTDKGYELQKAFDEGKGVDVYAAKALGIFTDEDIVAAQFGAIEARVVAKEVAIREQTIAEFEATLKDMPSELQEAYKEGGIEGYNKYLEDNYTKLPDEQWIGNEQLAEIKETEPDIYTILMTQGSTAANKAIQELNAEIKKQQEAISELAGYKVAIPPELPEGIDAVTGAPIKHGYNLVAYFRDNPEKIDLLITAGYDADVVTKLSAAVVATDKYWTPDNRLDVYAAYVGGVEPEYLETLTDKKIEDIKGLAPSYREFLRSYEVTNPKPETVWIGTYPGEALEWQKAIAKWTKEANTRYEELYGTGSSLLAQARMVTTAAFLPARALEPRVEIGDIKWWEWTIGGAQIALYTSPFWVPQVAKVLKPLSKLEKSARTAGNTRLEVNIAREEMLARAWNDPSYARFASNLQHQIQASMKADKIFLSKLAALSRITPQQLTSIERLSGIKGLATSIEAVGKARIAVASAWGILDKSKYYIKPTTTAQRVANEAYLTRLGVLQSAQNNLASALARVSGTMTPVYQLSPMAGWTNVIGNTEREIARLNTELAKAEVTMGKAALPTTRAEAHKYWLDVKSQLTNAQSRLKGYQVASAAGDIPPNIARYLVVTQTPTQASIESLDKMLKEIDDWLKGKGAYKPVVSPESALGTSPVATAVRATDKIVVPKTIPKTKLIPVAAEVVTKPAVAAPAVTPPPGVSVFPGIVSPKVKVTTRTATTTEGAEHIGAMTPEQAQRLYGDEIQIVEAVSPYLIAVEAVKPAEWLSPAQAIKEAQRIALQSYIQQISQSAIQQATQLKAQAATQAAIQSAVQQAIQTKVKAIEDTALQTQVLQGVQTQTAIKQIIGTEPIIITPIEPIIIEPIESILPLLFPKATYVEDAAGIIKPGTITWRQGLFWIVIPPPYNKKYYTKKQPPGVTKVATGKGSAYKTIQVIGGLPNKDVDVNVGWAIVKIRVKARDVTIEFLRGPQAGKIEKEQWVKAEGESKSRPARGRGEMLDEFMFGGKDEGKSVDEFYFGKKPKRKKVKRKEQSVDAFLFGVRK